MFGALSPPNRTPCSGSLVKYFILLLRMSILGVMPPLVMLPMVVSPSSSSFFSDLKPILGDNRTSTCRSWRSSPHTLLEVCSAHKDNIEIKCMGYVDGKTPTELEILNSSLILGINRLMWCTLFIYNMVENVRCTDVAYNLVS